MNQLICEFCGSEFGTKSGLDQHQKKAKYCLELRSNDNIIQKEIIPNSLRSTRREEVNLAPRARAGEIIAVPPISELHAKGLLVFRGQDGYIDVTSLCKAGQKAFNAWNRLKKTKVFLECLSNELKVPIDRLTDYSNRRTYAHPQVAINIAQWISPEFDIRVSKWIYQIMITGSFNFASEKSSLELDRLSRENRMYAEKIAVLEKKLLQRQERVNYPPNTIYVVSTKEKEKRGEYKIGKAKNLKNRLSVYNTSEEHIVYFYLPCKSVREMDILEKVVHNQLEQQRIDPNREWFRGSVKFFTDEIEGAAQRNGYI